MKLIVTIIFFLFSINLSFAQDQPDGTFKDYYDSGELKVVGQYKSGKRIGAWKSFHKNGLVSSLYSYKKGKRNKDYTSYYKDGTLRSKTEKIDDEYIRTGYYESGKLKHKRQVETGYYKGYFESGAIKLEADYLKFDLVGDWKRYYENGQLEWVVAYKEGYRHGPYKYYSENGDLKLEGDNAKDKIHGEEKRFLPNNVIEWIGNYNKGLMTNTWTKYNLGGDKLEKVKFKNGEVSQLKFANILTPTKMAEGVMEHFPIYPGCEDVLTNKKRKVCMNRNVSIFINKNFNTDIAINLTKGKKRIKINFKVDKKGGVDVVKVTAPSAALKLEAYRVIMLLPKIKPGMQRGKPVIVPFNIPVVFQVN